VYEATVYVKLEALTLDRSAIHSNEYSFPLKLCWGCLIRRTTNDPTAPPTGSTVPCFVGQDDGVDDTVCNVLAFHRRDPINPCWVNP